MTTSSHITDNNNDGDKDGCDADVVDNTNTAGKTSITTSSDASCSGCSSVEADGSDETSSDDDVINDLDQLDIICTIGTGTFGRVYLVKSKCTVRSRYYALKAMRIHSVVTTKQVEHVYSEKRILAQLIEHPFVVRLYGTFTDRACLYMRFEFAPGGELFSYLRAAGRFGNRMSRFYAAEIICAIEYMHARHIVYRDLKPENIMLDREGHVKITDFGFAKVVNDRTWTLCGTPEYLAPEVISNKGHNRAVDFWALGILVYEMHAGFTPWHGNNALEVYDKILDAKLKFPKSFNLIARDFCRKLLQTDRTLRLGCMKNGIADVKSHKWFIAEVDWDDVFARKLIPPLVPTLYHDGDTGNFDSYDEESTTSYDPASPAERDLFVDW